MKEKFAKGIATFECTYLCVGKCVENLSIMIINLKVHNTDSHFTTQCKHTLIENTKLSGVIFLLILTLKFLYS